MRLDEVQQRDEFGVKTPNPRQVAKKHDVSVEDILSQLEIGIEVEKEHTMDPDLAREIALDHLNELPDYYTRLLDMEHSAEGKDGNESIRNN